MPFLQIKMQKTVTTFCIFTPLPLPWKNVVTGLWC